MKQKIKPLIAAFALLCLMIAQTAFAQGTAFTYQGLLENNGVPANGTYDFSFTLFNAATNGAVAAGPVTNSGVAVTTAPYCVSLNQTSDRNAKENFKQVPALEVLDKVAALPISRWNFKQDQTAEHMGPMAQDFYDAFHIGSDDRHIAIVDEGGVALAAIQGLNLKLEDRTQRSDALIHKLETESRAKDAEIGDLKDRLAAFEAIVERLDPNRSPQTNRR